MMCESFLVRIAKEELTFSAAHFITYAGNICERLHGHNYGIAVEVGGPLDENHYVVDFIALRDVLKTLVGELDHRVMLPTQHPLIRVTPQEDEVHVHFEDRRWIFPRGDCVLVDVPNTTAEEMARHLGLSLLDLLQNKLGVAPTSLEVSVDECAGQQGVWRM
jgi:6-pyruvoyltetrahydropterin/6-carboxytetrahydropterin synthase